MTGGVGHGEVADRVCAEEAPRLQANGGRGQRWRGYRRVVDGIVWKLQTGAPIRVLLTMRVAHRGIEVLEPWTICTSTRSPPYSS